MERSKHYTAFNHTWTESSTIFGDVELGGWSSDQTINQWVYTGFMLELDSLGWNPCVYSSPYNWDTLMGNNFAASYAKVAWEVNYPNSICSYCPTTFDPKSFGGMTPTIWQYQQANPRVNNCANDLNIATSLPI